MMNHVQRYLKMLKLCGRENVDCHYHAAFFLLSDRCEIAEKAYHFIASDGIDFDEMLRQVFSSGEERLVRVAYSLYSLSDPGIPVYELANLSHADYELVYIAMYIANGQFKVSIGNRGEQPEIGIDKSGYERVAACDRWIEELYTQ